MDIASLQLSPHEAWLPWEPSTTSPFDRRAAAHLYRRAGFGASFAEIAAASTKGLTDTLADLFSAPQKSASYYDEAQQFATSLLAGNNPETLSAWWLHQMRFSPAPLLEKTTLFWHGHFATSAAKVNNAKLMLRQNHLLRTGALGPFSGLIQAISRDPAMLLYLDSATNRKTQPNENFAREVMELFCLGVDQYSEHDIQQLARCFTGWEIQHNEFKFNPYQHDTGVKRLFNREADWDGDAALEIVIKQPACADFITRKLLRYFVADECDWPAKYVAPLTESFRSENYSVATLVQTIVSSRVFFASSVRGAKVRIPVEFCVGLVRGLDTTVNFTSLVERLRQLGQLPLYPPNVKGWNGGREWINASTLLARANVASQVIATSATRFGGATLPEYFEKCGWRGGEQVVDGLTEMFLAIELPTDVRQQWIADFNTGNATAEQRSLRLVQRLAALPEFQLA